MRMSSKLFRCPATWLITLVVQMIDKIQPRHLRWEWWYQKNVRRNLNHSDARPYKTTRPWPDVTFLVKRINLLFLCFITRAHLGLKWYIFLTYLVCVNQSRDVGPYLFSNSLFSRTRVRVVGVLTRLIRGILNIVNVALFPKLTFRIDRLAKKEHRTLDLNIILLFAFNC